MMKILDIQKVVCRQYGITMEDLLSKGRPKEFAVPRNLGMYLAKEFTDHSAKRIAYAFNRNCHSAVSDAVNKIEEKLLHDLAFYAKFLEVKEEVMIIALKGKNSVEKLLMLTRGIQKITELYSQDKQDVAKVELFKIQSLAKEMAEL